ncbi:hypothetical protein KPL70_011549 [Citrus sinensis]|nr:hypothetical protein KPL70_011549 [Citrus sinensis]
MPKQSCSLSSPREMKGSSSSLTSSSSSSEEFAAEDFDREARSCSMALKYSSSVLALAKRDWALDFWVRKVCWALEASRVGWRRFLEESQSLIMLTVNLDYSSNFRANTVIPKPIQWKDVHLPEEWILEGAAPPAIPKQLEPNTELQSVTQYSDGKHLTRIENQFQQSTISVSPSPKPIPSKSDSDKKLKEPIFKPFQVSKTSQKLVHESKSDFAKAIREQLDRIEAASSSSSKIQIAPDTPKSSKIGVLEQDQVSIASSDLEAFTEEPVSKANKIHWELAIPTSKSPPDLTIDNRPSALNQARYNASSVYEWNIDGMSEYNILGVLQQMTMAANAYKTQSGTSDKAIAEILIAGFTGQLKGWWDHLLTKLQQLDILNAIQTDESGAPILDEFNNPIQDAVATLILTISLHFIGDPSHLRDKNAELLHNLRCRKLSDFQEYKTTFFTRLFLRDDANHVTWKEKFLAGLPTLLGEKVRNSIKALYDNRIPYDELTYGELVSFVNKEGLKICQDLKLQKRLKQELRRSKQELGSFCKQFNYDPFKASTSKDCNGKCSSKPYKKHYKSKSHRKPFHDFRKLPYKKPSRPYKKHSFSKKKEFKAKPKTPFNFKDATCFKCGMKGHTAKFCRMNKRLQELDLNEDILSKIAPLLIESSDSESSMSGDSDPLQVDELIDSDTSASSNSDSDSDSYLKKINVLTKDQEIFLELVKHISDPNLQKDYLDKLLKTMDSDKAGTSTEISKSKLTVNMIKDWLSSKNLLQPTLEASRAQQTFLTQKSKAQSLLASAKTEDEYFKAMEQLLASRSKSSAADSSEDEDEDEDVNDDEEPFISLGDDNEDDCFGIFSPIKHSNTVIPKPIQWKDVNLPDEWILEGATAPVIPKQLEPNTELQNVTQYSYAPDSAQSSKIGVLEQDNVSIASSDIEAFKEEPVSKANKIYWELAIPTVKSPLDLAIDNRPAALNQSRFNASSVYEWNIDGMSEYNILRLLQQMTMAANAYKTQSGTSNKAIVEILIAGFTGQLKGLPTLLGGKVRNSIKILYDNCIPYDELTYGELVSFVNKEGLKICQDLKLQKRLKWELRKSKQELGSFCKQFNYDPFKTSTSKDCNGKCSSRPYKKHYKSKSHRKSFQEFREPSYKKPSKPYTKPNFSKKKDFRAKRKAPFNYKEATCYKCGKKCHIAKFCRMNRKLHELGLDEETLSKVTLCL